MKSPPKVDIKVVVLGKEFVGKTALVERFLYDNFSSNSYQPTIGAAYGARQVKNKNNVPIVMGIWDTAGSERYQSMTKMYYRNAKAAILCYDMCDSVSFKRLDYWVQELRNTEPDCLIFICGCKKDLIQSNKNQRAVNEYLVNEFATSLGAKVYETSSKTAEGIVQLFEDICNEVSDNPAFLSDTMKKNILLENNSKKPFSICPNC